MLKTSRFDSRSIVLNTLKDVVKKLINHVPIEENLKDYKVRIDKYSKHVGNEVPVSIFRSDYVNKSIGKYIYKCLKIDFMRDLFNDEEDSLDILDDIKKLLKDRTGRSMNYKRYSFNTQINKIRKVDEELEERKYKSVYVSQKGGEDLIYLVNSDGDKKGYNLKVLEKKIGIDSTIERYSFDEYIRRNNG